MFKNCLHDFHVLLLQTLHWIVTMVDYGAGVIQIAFLGQGHSALTSVWTLPMGLTQSRVRDTQQKGLHRCESLVIVKEHTGSENQHTVALRRSKLRSSRIQGPLRLGWAAGSEGHTWSLE